MVVKVFLQESHPHIYAQIHPTKNSEDGIDISDLTSGMHRRIWWQCEQGHEWQSVVYSRMTRGCPYCSGCKVLTGYNDLQTVAPHVASQFHPTKNGNLSPSELAPNSNLKLWWICTLGHEWETSACKRVSQGTGCPVCTNRIVLPGFNDLASLNPELSKQWHPFLNSELTPQMVTPGANRSVWWVCERGHEYKSVINNRNRGNGCGICYGQVLLVGFNDLRTKFAAVADQWHPTRNDGLSPETVLAGSHKRVWWKCHEGHEWKTTVSSRTHAGQGCKYCAGQAAVPGVNDLETLNPEVARQWNHEKNGIGLLPSMVTEGSNQKVWWVCDEGHEWATTVSSRKRGSRCRICVGAGTSKTALQWYEELSMHISDLEYEMNIPVRWKTNSSMIVDMISMTSNVIIEYDGWYYHSGERSGKSLEEHLGHDAQKTLPLLEAGYIVVRIREGRLPHLDINHEHLFQINCNKNGDIGKESELIKDFINRC